MNSIFDATVDPFLRLKMITVILVLTGISMLIYKIYNNEKEFNRFFQFHNKATSNITSSTNIEDYPFFKDHRLHMVQNNIKAIENYLVTEKNAIIEDKNNLQTIISDISHQVKTPTANIKMINEILLSRELDENQSKEFIESMNSEVNKLDFLMQSMITISFLETGIMKFNIRILPIYDTVLLALNSSMSLINEKEIDIKVICREDILVKHDQRWTAEAIYNVINNAAKFSEIKGNIIIEVIQEQFYTSISIEDNGLGISNDNIKNIFNKFHSKDKKDGSGIGLYLTQKIIKSQNGYINVESELNHGTKFILYLPNE